MCWHADNQYYITYSRYTEGDSRIWKWKLNFFASCLIVVDPSLFQLNNLQRIVMTMWIKRWTTLTTNRAHVVVFVVQLFSNDSIQKMKSEKKMRIHWDRLINNEISLPLTNMIDRSCKREMKMTPSRNDSYRMILHWVYVCEIKHVELPVYRTPLFCVMVMQRKISSN
jgi:hypothetical protein